MTTDEYSYLRDSLKSAGIDQRKAEDICLLLHYKPENVQQAFRLRFDGLTYRQIGHEIGVSHEQARRYIKRNCKDVKHLLDKSL